MKIFSTLPILLVLVAATLVAQPRVEEERPLARALRSASIHFSNGSYSRALAELEPALDSAGPSEPIADALYLMASANFEMKRYQRTLTEGERFLAEYPHDRRTPAILYLRGISAYQVGDTNLALRSFKKVGGFDEGRNPYYWIARIYAERGMADSAEKYVTYVTTTAAQRFGATPFNVDAHYLHAWLMERRGQLDSAAALYREVIEWPEKNDLTLDAQLRLGVIDAQRGNYESALRLLNSITPRSTRQREEQLFYLGEMSAALERYDDALRYNTEYVREFPSSRRIRLARYGVGWAQLKLGKHDEAIATFRQLERGIDSIAAASAYQIGAVQVLRGDTAGALRTFEALVERLPYESFSDNAYYQLGRIFYRRAAYDSARHYLLIAARQFPESELRGDSYYLLGEAYSALSDANNAQYAFSRARKSGATDEIYRRALYREGVMLYKVGRFNSAIDRLREYVSKHQSGEQIADATFWLGEALYQHRAYDEAERYYDAYLEKHAATEWREDALYGLAWSRFQQKDFKGAASAFSSFIKDNPKSRLATEATIRLADAYRLMGDYSKAVETYESIGKLTGKGARDEEARFQLARVLLQMEKVDRAIDAFRELIRDYPSSPHRDAYAFNIGAIYLDRKMDSLAIAELMPFPESYPKSELVPDALLTIGNAYYNLELYDSSLVYYRRILDEHPNSAVIPDAMDAVKFSLNELGRGIEAVAIIDSFQARNPNRIPADSLSFRKASITFDQGQFAEAIALFNKLVADHPQSPLAAEAVFQVGQTYELMDHLDSALIIYGQVIERYPASSAASNALIEGADIKLQMTEWSDAAADYEGFTSRYPESDRINEARYGIAVARLALRDTMAALEQLERVLKSSDEEDLFLDKSRIAIARIIAPRGGTDRALDLLAAVVARRMDDVAADALLYRSELLVKANDLSGAVSELRRLVTDFETFPEYTGPGMLLLGRTYENLTNYTSAREVYNQLIATTEDPAMKREAEARLKKLKR